MVGVKEDSYKGPNVAVLGLMCSEEHAADADAEVHPEHSALVASWLASRQAPIPEVPASLLGPECPRLETPRVSWGAYL